MQPNPRKTTSLRHLGKVDVAQLRDAVNNMGIHAVRNDGTTDRIDLIFEYYDLDQPDPDWIQA